MQAFSLSSAVGYPHRGGVPGPRALASSQRFPVITLAGEDHAEEGVWVISPNTQTTFPAFTQGRRVYRSYPKSYMKKKRN